MDYFVPQYRLVITYDILTTDQQAYYQYVLWEFVPALRSMELPLLYAWHTAYGNYPIRQLEFGAQDWVTVQGVVHSPRFQSLENRLQSYTTNYHRKLIHFERRFQF